MDSQQSKVAKKHLYHMVYFRICHYLSVKYTMRTHSISKMEKAFDLEGVSVMSLKRLFLDLNRLNEMVKDYFIQELNPICISLGELLLEWVQRFEKLSTFYNDANFISLLVYSLTDQDPNYFGITSEWMEKESKNLTLSLRSAINDIDHHIKKMLG